MISVQTGGALHAAVLGVIVLIGLHGANAPASAQIQLPVETIRHSNEPAHPFEPQLLALARGRIAELVGRPIVIEAVRAQNRKTGQLGQAEIDKLDRIWRAETESADQPMIDEVMERPLSLFLFEEMVASEGLFTEIFVTDAKGLNVGQSRVTTDFWQGDEDKWQEVVAGGPGAIHISPLREDDSTQTVQSQVSVPVLEPLDGQLIGVAIIGVNVERL